MIVVNKKGPSEVGGVEVVLRQMIDALTDMDIVVLTFNYNAETVESSYKNTPVIRLGARFPTKPFRWAKDYKKRLKALAEEHDTIFYHYPSFQPEFYPIKFKQKIVYYHADVTKWGIIGSIYQRIIANRFLEDADRILVSNPNIINTSKTLRKFKEKCSVVNLGIDGNHFSYKADNYREQFLEEGEENLLLFVGRMSRYKGFSYILKCLTTLDDTNRLVVVSKDDYKQKDYEYIKNNHLERRITKISDASYEDLPYYYSSADLLLMPSTDRAEAFGIVAVEAMACSVPVISTELGTGTSYHNIDGVTGRIISPHSTEELHDSIGEVIGANLDKHAIRKRADEFSIERFNRNIRAAIRVK
jgi:glycosyltransferase involved in cell wall biosynthesis